MPSMDEEDDVRRFLVRGTGSQMGANQSVKDLLDLIRTELTFQHQADAVLSQASPVQNTWYTVLDTTLNVRLIYIMTKQTNDEGGAKNLNLQVTIDGVVLTRNTDLSAAHNTSYYCCKYRDAGELSIGTSAINMGGYDSMEGRSVKIEARITSAPGTNQVLTCRVTYAKR